MTKSNNFDALRLLGALAVFVNHQFVLSGHGDINVAGSYTLGTTALFLFFAVSGYLVAGSWLADPEPVRYLARRTLRMAPGWIVLMVLTLAVQKGLDITSFPDNPYPWFNGSLWTLPLEILCYLVLANLALLLPLRVGAVIMLVVLVLFGRFIPITYGFELFLTFTAGTLLRAYELPRMTLPWILAILLIFFLLATRTYIAYPVIFAVALFAVLVGRASWPGVRSMGRYGDFSYGIYIYSFPVQQFTVMWMGTQRPFWQLFLVSALVTGIFAALSWYFVESPSLKLKRWLPAKPVPARAVQAHELDAVAEG